MLWFKAFYILVNKVTLSSPMFGPNGIISVVLWKQNLINFVRSRNSGKDFDINNVRYISKVTVGRNNGKDFDVNNVQYISNITVGRNNGKDFDVNNVQYISKVTVGRNSEKDFDVNNV